MESKEKSAALELLEQLIELEQIKDQEHLQLLAEKKVYRKGESAVLFHLRALRELIERI
jgi:hypothetical protein